MSYTDSLLANGERVLRRAHQHWFVPVWDARWAILAIVLAALLLVLRASSGQTGPVMDALGIVTLVLFVGGVVWAVWSYLRYRNEEYSVTNRRVIHVEGVINKKSTDSSLEKINDAELTHNLIGRIFRFGDLDILTASETGIDRLRMLRDASQFKKAMLEAKHELELEYNRPISPPLRATAPGHGGDPAADPSVAMAAGMAAAGAESGTGSVGGPSGPPTSSAYGSTSSSPGYATGSASTPEAITDALARLADLRDRGAITPADYEAKKAELLARL